MRILFVTSDKFPPIRPAAMAIFGHALPRRGHRVDWLVQARGEEVGRGRRTMHRGEIFLAGTDDGGSGVRRVLKHAKDLCNDLKVIKLVAARRYDLVQVKDKYLSAVIALVVCKATRTGFFFWLAFPHAEASLHEVSQGTARYRWAYWLRGHVQGWLLYRVILRWADHSFVQSEQMKRDIAAKGIRPEKLTPVPGSLNLAELPGALEATARVPGKVVYLGTLNRMRRLDFLIRAFAVARRIQGNAVLHLVGGGDAPEDEAFLREAVAAEGLEDAVVFTGRLPMAQALEYVRDAAVGLSPYFPTPILDSTSPTKLIEYMAMGIPVVGNDHPEQRMVIGESGAGLCVPWQEEAFGKAIAAILRAPGQWGEMGWAGRRYVEQHRTNEVMTDRVEVIYLRWRHGHRAVAGAPDL